MSRQTTPGKFEGESLSTVYLYDIVNDGDGETFSDDCGGESYTIVDGPFDGDWTDEDDTRLDPEELAEVTSSVGAILHESEQGFVSATWYDNQDEYNAAVAEVEDMYADPEDNDNDEIQPAGSVADLDEFTQAYIDCALWASTDENGKALGAGDGPNETESMSHGLTVDDLAPSALQSIVDDCRAFQRDNAGLLEQAGNAEQNGHDFFLTRNRHGAGFWDRGYPSHVGRVLSDRSHEYGSSDLYIGDDGRVYVS